MSLNDDDDPCSSARGPSRRRTHKELSGFSDQAVSVAAPSQRELASRKYKLYGRESYHFKVARRYLAEKCDQRPQHAMDGCGPDCELGGCPVYMARAALVECAKAYALAKAAGLAKLHGND